MKKRKAILVTFTIRSEMFKSNYERNCFFRGLYGWKQIIRKANKKYVYRREGILNKIPHIRVDESVFIILKKHFEEIERFLREWEDKVMWDTFEVLLDEEKCKKLLEVI